MAGESHMEETCAAEAVPNCMRQTGTIAVRVSIPVCSQSDSKAWRRQPNAACRQVSDPTLDFPYAIALPSMGAGWGGGDVAPFDSIWFAKNSIASEPR